LVVPLGRLTSLQVHAVVAAAQLGSGDLVITPWNGLIVTDLPMAVGSTELDRLAATLAAAGLPSTADSGWIGVSACTGAPGCARAAGPTAPVATRIAARGAGADPVHVVACERRCGAPAVAHREVMIELTGELSRHRPARTDDGRTMRRRTGPLTEMSTAASESA
jgi:precorrin-3B synthase